VKGDDKMAAVALMSDDSIPPELVAIDKLKWSEEVRLGRYLIELASKENVTVGPWDEGFFRLAARLYSRLTQKEKNSLQYSYCCGKILPRVAVLLPSIRRAIGLYGIGQKPAFIEFVLDTESLIGEELRLVDYEFLYAHQGGSGGNDLEHHLTEVIGSSTCRSPLRKGHLKGEKIGRIWYIPFSEVLRAVKLARNWIGIKRFGVANKANPDELYRFAVANGYKVETNISMARSIRRSEASNLLKAYKRLKEESRDGARSFRRFAQKNELSTAEFAALFQATETTVRNWVKAQHIKATRRKHCLFIKQDQVQVFANRVANRQVRTSRRISERCHEILADS